MLGKAMMYLAPVGMLISGSFFPMPIGVLLYFLANNVWTLGQVHLLTSKINREEQREQELQRQRQAAAHEQEADARRQAAKARKQAKKAAKRNE